MKTPDEIKKAIAYCAEGECGYCKYHNNWQTCTEELLNDTLAYIQQLEAAAQKWTCRTEDMNSENADEIKPYREISMPVTNVDNVDLIKECSYRLIADISDYLEQLATPKWISVEDALPQAGRICAVYGRGRDNQPRYDLAIMDKARTWEFGAMSGFEITHWMALPQPPKEEEHD